MVRVRLQWALAQGRVEQSDLWPQSSTGMRILYYPLVATCMHLVAFAWRFIFSPMIYAYNSLRTLQLFTGKLPFPDMVSDAAVVAHVMSGGTPRAPQAPTGTLNGFWDFVESCWNPNPQLRPTSGKLVSSLPLRSSPLSAALLRALPHTKWKIPSPTDSPSSGPSAVGNDILDSCIIGLLDIDDGHEKPWSEAAARLARCGCPETVIHFVQNAIDNGDTFDSGAIASDQPLPRVANDETIEEEPQDEVEIATHVTSLQRSAGELRERGMYREAAKELWEAVQLLRNLAKEHSNEFNAGLVYSLRNLAFDLHALGEHSMAVRCNQEAVALLRGLVRQDPDKFAPDLADSLARLAADLHGGRKHSEGMKCNEDAVGFLRGLAAKDPIKFGPEFVKAVRRFVYDLKNHGKHADVLEHNLEAVVLLRSLADHDRDKYSPELALSLFHVAHDFGFIGRYAESSESNDESIKLFRTFAP